MTDGLHLTHPDQPCRICGWYGGHVHTSEECERIRRDTATQLDVSLDVSGRIIPRRHSTQTECGATHQGWTCNLPKGHTGRHSVMIAREEYGW